MAEQTSALKALQRKLLDQVDYSDPKEAYWALNLALWTEDLEQIQTVNARILLSIDPMGLSEDDALSFARIGKHIQDPAFKEGVITQLNEFLNDHLILTPAQQSGLLIVAQELADEKLIARVSSTPVAEVAVKGSGQLQHDLLRAVKEYEDWDKEDERDPFEQFYFYGDVSQRTKSADIKAEAIRGAWKYLEDSAASEEGLKLPPDSVGISMLAILNDPELIDAIAASVADQIDELPLGKAMEYITEFTIASALSKEKPTRALRMLFAHFGVEREQPPRLPLPTANETGFAHRLRYLRYSAKKALSSLKPNDLDKLLARAQGDREAINPYTSQLLEKVLNEVMADLPADLPAELGEEAIRQIFFEYLNDVRGAAVVGMCRAIGMNAEELSQLWWAVLKQPGVELKTIRAAFEVKHGVKPPEPGDTIILS